MKENYYDHFNAEKNYKKLLFNPARGLQSAEMNELQSMQAHQIKKIVDFIFSDGSIQKGGKISINRDAGTIACEEAEIYLRGAIHTAKSASFEIPMSGVVFVGVWYVEEIISALHDPSLRDPAEGTKNFDEAGADRLKIVCEWGTAEDDKRGNFYKIYEIVDGNLKTKSAPPEFNALNAGLARYDRDNNSGNYVVDGFILNYHKKEGETVHFSLSKGKAHVLGYEVEYSTDERIIRNFDPDLQAITSEPHHANGSRQRVNVARAPIHKIRKIDITKLKTVNVTHGTYSGVSDPLPDNSVIEVLEVKQSNKIYQKTNDWIFQGGLIDWSPSGEEPAPGSTYSVKYKYITQTEALNPDERGFEIEGAAADSLILVDYESRLKRIDTVLINREGELSFLKGIPSAFKPYPTKVPQGFLELAQINFNWFIAAPAQVKVTATRAVNMDVLQDLIKQVSKLDYLIAREMLKTDAIASAPSSTRGIFVDPFNNDNMRDLGEEQNAHIENGILSLAVNTSEQQLDKQTKALILPFEREVIIEQIARTGSKKINPYSSIDPLPEILTLQPAVDYWTTTRTIDRGREIRTGFLADFTTKRLIAEQQEQFLRPIEITFSASGFKENEEVRRISFDGLDLRVQA